MRSVFKIGEYLNGLVNESSNPKNMDAKEKFTEQFNLQKAIISARWYHVMGKAYILHIIIPSHSVKNVSYDVIFEFNTKKIDDIDPLKTPCKVFSNCPSFTFIYAKVFYDNGILCDWLKKKYPKDIIRKEPDITNPLHLIGYERSLYVASLYIKNAKNSIGKTVVNRRFNQIENIILSSDKILEEYQRQKELENKNTRSSQPKGKTIGAVHNIFTKKTGGKEAKTSSVKTTKVTQNIAKMRHSSSIKKTKKK